jgi:hypothetical protein
MCGICGIYHFDRAKPVSRSDLAAMNSTLRHRGPDGEGYFVDGNVGFGHKRLSIIDLATGDQPMRSADGSVTIAFNGEIYNYRDLRAELEGLGHAFRTSSDTEVIIAAYRQWGRTCQSRFNGMWAFAIWDGGKGELFISRDRLGVKPLFYAVTPEGLFFASEAKALLAVRSFEKRHDIFELFLSLSYLPRGVSAWRGIEKLAPGLQPARSSAPTSCRKAAVWETSVILWSRRPISFMRPPSNGPHAPSSTIDGADTGEARSVSRSPRRASTKNVPYLSLNLFHRLCATGLRWRAIGLERRSRRPEISGAGGGSRRFAIPARREASSAGSERSAFLSSTHRSPLPAQSLVLMSIRSVSKSNPPPA